MRRRAFLMLVPVFLLLGLIPAFAQQRLRFTAEKIQGRRVSGERIDYLIGNVVIRQQATTIWADSASVQKSTNRAEGFGRIRVQEGDSITITSKSLVYDGQTGTAIMTKDVVYRDGSATLYTDNLQFNKFTGVSSYHSGGRLINNSNTLTSRQGTYDRPNQQASFFGKVVLTSPDATVYSDTLYYNTLTGQARFVGPTKVVKNDGTVVDAKEGLTHNTQSEASAVLQGFIENQDYYITGNRLRYNRQQQLYTAEGRVVMTAKDQQVIIEGDEARYDRTTGITRVWGRPLMKRPVQGDTLFMSADTMMSVESDIEAKKRLLAWGRVKIFKQDLQGVADSLAYRLADSLLFFYRQPVLWSEDNQMTGDTISLQIRNNQVERMRLIQNGFVISKDTVTNNYNQVKGRLITAFFGEDELRQIAVNGNAESIYFVLEDGEPQLLMGMNRITCSNMLIAFKDRKVNQIRFYQQPEALFVPPHELEEPATRLPGFQWLEERRPARADVLNRKLAPEAKPAATAPAAAQAVEAGAQAPKEQAPVAAPARNRRTADPGNRPAQIPNKPKGGRGKRGNQ